MRDTCLKTGLRNASVSCHCLFSFPDLKKIETNPSCWSCEIPIYMLSVCLNLILFTLLTFQKLLRRRATRCCGGQEMEWGEGVAGRWSSEQSDFPEAFPNPLWLLCLPDIGSDRCSVVVGVNSLKTTEWDSQFYMLLFGEDSNEDSWGVGRELDLVDGKC